MNIEEWIQEWGRRAFSGCCGRALALTLISSLLAGTANAQSITQTAADFQSGQYETVIEQASAAVKRSYNERWARLLIKSYLAVGDYDAAFETYQLQIERYRTSITLGLLGIESLEWAGRHDEAHELAQTWESRIIATPTRYSGRDNLIAIGRFFSERGQDARQILTQFYDRVRKSDPAYLETYIATAELALLKQDYATASKTLAEALEISGDDPRVLHLSALAWQSTDPKKADQFARRTLAANPRYADAWLFQAENFIDQERFDKAEMVLQKVEEVHPGHWAAASLRAVIAQVLGDQTNYKEHLSDAFDPAKENADAYHLIGRKLSDKYRFAEAAEMQQLALQFEPDHQAATLALAQDLLRLGREEEGWEAAQASKSNDPYNVVAHNLMTLRDEMSKMNTIEREGLKIRMDAREARLHGDAVAGLLSEARSILCKKYQVELDEPTLIEIFDRQADFAIRTFGLPGGQGYLGVCFGRVITANSPSSQGAFPPNLHAVLWHEFAHVVTLQKTKNRMPRWLSEGISVYEERQKNIAWGEGMSPTYQAMIQSGQLTPIAELTEAFLKPPTPQHLLFAYYQCSLVVEYIVDEYGFDRLLDVLDDLRDGISINDALSARVAPLNRLQIQFDRYAHDLADSFAPGVQFQANASNPNESGQRSRQRGGRGSDNDKEPGLADDPKNGKNDGGWYEPLAQFSLVDHQATLRKAQVMIRGKQFEQAIDSLRPLRKMGAVSGDRGGVLDNLATCYRGLQNETMEAKMLRERVAIDSDSSDALMRLYELASERDAWLEASIWAQQLVETWPTKIETWNAVADAAEKNAQWDVASKALAALAEFPVIDPAELHYRRSVAAKRLGDIQNARRFALLALDQAPRYREAGSLLLKIVNEQSTERQSEKLQ
ncbi:MAG: hypothetical protein AAF664_06680 [Planctomycetota bacterium]